METYKLSHLPDSLYYIPNFITADEEEQLISSVQNVPRTRWVQLRNRRLQNWGGQPQAKGMIQTEALPQWLDPFTARVFQMDSGGEIYPRETFKFNHCLVNEYESGQGIMPHTDGPAYYPIVTTISLQSPTVIEFYRPIDNEKNEVSSFADRCVARVFLEPRSLFIVKDLMYSFYLHGIEELHEDLINRERISNYDRDEEQRLKRTTRISLTIRYVEKTTKLPVGFMKK